MPNNPAQTAADAVRKTILDAYHKAVQAGTLPAGAPEGFDVSEPREKNHGDLAANLR